MLVEPNILLSYALSWEDIKMYLAMQAEEAVGLK